ncbi:MAG: phosphoribosylaminoimidazolesuccinocarboxamide synthase, partial [Myxococcales bacterium]|nr:phosphoribosylaminoimidazolesuccinocarboxamide synthase [Myxococcales bacterium]
MPVSRELIRQAIADDLILDSLPAEFDGLGQRYSGKVRENFSLASGERLIVVSDRVSAFDRVLGTIPFKGQVLNGLAAHWFETTASLFPNHMLAVPDAAAMRVVECEPFKIEMVVRGYLTGSSSTSIWRAYEKGERRFCGHTLPEGLQRHQQLAANIVTPTTKAAKGDHDVSMGRDELIERGIITPEDFDAAADIALRLFAFGQRHCAAQGLILVDTKYEFGVDEAGQLVLIDEVHTP